MGSDRQGLLWPVVETLASYLSEVVYASLKPQAINSKWKHFSSSIYVANWPHCCLERNSKYRVVSLPRSSSTVTSFSCTCVHSGIFSSSCIVTCSVRGFCLVQIGLIWLELGIEYLAAGCKDMLPHQTQLHANRNFIMR